MPNGNYTKPQRSRERANLFFHCFFLKAREELTKKDEDGEDDSEFFEELQQMANDLADDREEKRRAFRRARHAETSSRPTTHHDSGSNQDTEESVETAPESTV